MSTSTKIVKNPINKLFVNLLIKFAGYFDGKHYRFSLVENELTLTPANDDFSAKLIIVSSDFYQEKKLALPIVDRKEINKLLKLQLESSEIAVVQNQINNQSNINTWRFNDKVTKVWVNLPESLLFAQNCQNGEVLSIEDENNTTTFITSFDGVIQSSKCNSFINSPEKFAMSTGISLHQKHTIDSASKAKFLAANLTKLKLANLLNFINKPAAKTLKLFSTQFILPGAILFALYLFLTSSYLIIKTSWAEDKLAQQSEELTQLLTLQTSLDNNQKRYKELVKFWSGKSNVAGLWLVMVPILERSTLRSLTKRDSSFYLRGRTKNASELLELIANNDNVANARFEAPVRKDRNQDSFHLSFKLAETFVMPTKQNADNGEEID